MIALVGILLKKNAEEPLPLMTMILLKLVSGCLIKAKSRRRKILKFISTKITQFYCRHRLQATSNKKILRESQKLQQKKDLSWLLTTCLSLFGQWTKSTLPATPKMA